MEEIESNMILKKRTAMGIVIGLLCTGGVLLALSTQWGDAPVPKAAPVAIEVAQTSNRQVDSPGATAAPPAYRPPGITSQLAPLPTPTPRPVATQRPAGVRVVYVMRADAVLKQSEDRLSPVVAKLKQGDALQVVQEAPGRLKVKTSSGQTGFISTLNVSDVPPASERQRPNIVLGGDIGAGERSSTTTIRGLSPVSEKVAERDKLPEAAVKDARKMEEISSSISNAELDSFLKEGGVSPE